MSKVTLVPEDLTKDTSEKVWVPGWNTGLGKCSRSIENCSMTRMRRKKGLGRPQGWKGYLELPASEESGLSVVNINNDKCSRVASTSNAFAAYFLLVLLKPSLQEGALNSSGILSAIGIFQEETTSRVLSLEDLV